MWVALSIALAVHKLLHVVSLFEDVDLEIARHSAVLGENEFKDTRVHFFDFARHGQCVLLVASSTAVLNVHFIFRISVAHPFDRRWLTLEDAHTC